MICASNRVSLPSAVSSSNLGIVLKSHRSRIRGNSHRSRIRENSEFLLRVRSLISRSILGSVDNSFKEHATDDYLFQDSLKTVAGRVNSLNQLANFLLINERHIAAQRECHQVFNERSGKLLAARF